jgi:hypothetical protein
MDKLLASYAGGTGLSAAPPVPVRVMEGDLLSGSGAQLQIFHNPRAEALFAPAQGPTRPFAASEAQRAALLPSGNVEQHHMEQLSFQVAVNDAHSVKRPKKKKTKQAPEEAASDSFQGPWRADRGARVAGGMSLEQLEALGREYEAAKRSKVEAEDAEGAPMPPQLPAAAPPTVGAAARAGGKKKSGPPAAIPCAVVADAEKDYLGRSWVEQGPRATVPVAQCFASKARVATMPRGHADAVTRLRAHKDGRLLLSASLDKSVRVWGTQQGRRTCLAEYWGHAKVRVLFLTVFS